MGSTVGVLQPKAGSSSFCPEDGWGEGFAGHGARALALLHCKAQTQLLHRHSRNSRSKHSCKQAAFAGGGGGQGQEARGKPTKGIASRTVFAVSYVHTVPSVLTHRECDTAWVPIADVTAIAACLYLVVGCFPAHVVL